MDKMTARDDHQGELKGLEFIQPKEVAKRSGNMSLNIKMTDWSVLTEFQSSLQFVLEISSDSRDVVRMAGGGEWTIDSFPRFTVKSRKPVFAAPTLFKDIKWVCFRSTSKNILGTLSRLFCRNSL